MSLEIYNKIEKATQYAKSKIIIDWQTVLFKDWKMSPILEEYFIKLCEKNPSFAKAVRNNVTYRLKDYIRECVEKCSGDPEKNTNVNLILLGEQNSGKSTYSIAIFLYYQKMHKEIWDRDVKNKFTFKTPETLEAYSEVEHFTMIDQDEDDDLVGDGSRTIPKQLGNLVKSARFTGISLSICCPTLTNIPGCDYALQPFGFGKEGDKLYRETGDFSKATGRAILYCKSRFNKEKYDVLGIVKMKMGSAIQYMKDNNYYELKKKNFYHLREDQGASGMDMKKNSENLKKYAEILKEKALEKGWDGISKKELDTWIDETDIPNLTAKNKEKLFNRTYRLNKKCKEAERENEKPSVKKEFDTSNDFQVNILEILSTLEKMDFKKWKFKERDIAIYKEMYTKPQLTNEQLIDHEELKTQFIDIYPSDQSVFTKIRAKLSGHISNVIGNEYELYRKAKYELNPEIKKVVHDGRKGKADLTLYYKNNKIALVSVKCFGFKGRSKSVKITKFAPEIEDTQKLLKKKKVVECFADIYNFYTKKLYKYSFSLEDIDKFTRSSKKTITIRS